MCCCRQKGQQKAPRSGLGKARQQKMNLSLWKAWSHHTQGSSWLKLSKQNSTCATHLQFGVPWSWCRTGCAGCAVSKN